MLSVIVPIYNEEDSLPLFYVTLKDELDKLHEEFEVVMVDDGSTDKSLEILTKLEKENKNINVFSFRKNQGKAEALTLGFQKAKGDIVITMDADLQDKPSEMHKFLNKYSDGYDVVCGWRRERKDSSKMKIISKLFNSLLARIYKIDIHDYNCGFKLYSKDAAKSLRLYGGLHRFIPLILSQNGYTLAEVAISHDPRKYGKSKYGFSKIWKDLPDMFTMLFLVSYGNKPLHFFGSIGLSLLVSGMIIFGYLVFLWIGGESIGRRPLLNFSILLMLGGMQIFFTGFLAELFINISQKDYRVPPLRHNTDSK